MNTAIHPKVAMLAPTTDLLSEQWLPWSRGRGVDVWAMITSAITGNLDTIRALVARDPRLVNCEYQYARPLRFAVRENQRAVVDFLLEQGAGLDTWGDSLITIARDRGHLELATFFESLVRDRYHIVPEGNAVSEAIRAFDVDRVKTMIDEDPSLVQAADERGNQPIHWAVLTRQIPLIDFLLERGADINAYRPDGGRPLDLTNGDYYYRNWYRDLPPTALQHHSVLIGYLIARGADYDISVAAKIGDTERVKVLLDKDPGLVNRLPAYTSYYSGLPLVNAAAGGHIETVKLLLQRGADPNAEEPPFAPQGRALHSAISRRHEAIVKLLLEHGANPNAAVESSGNCLSMAKHIGASQEMIDLIASYGGSLTMEIACYYGAFETLSAMLRVNPQLEVDQASFDAITQENQRRVIELILRFQPELLKQFTLGIFPEPDFARWLFERGLDPRRTNWLGATPLHKAAGDGNEAIAALCLEFGAAINAIDGDLFSTPLGWAARNGQTAMVTWLLERGADPQLPANEPWARPAAWAEKKGHPEIATLLNHSS